MHTRQRVADPEAQHSPEVVLEPLESRMYPAESNQDGQSRHARMCQAAFGRADERCSRCLELEQGARPRTGWQPAYFARKRWENQRRFLW